MNPTPAPPANAPRRRRSRRLLFGALACLLTLGASAVALEVGLRLFWGGFYIKPSGENVRHSATRGWENQPGYQGELGDPEYVMAVTHNALGFRGPEVAPTKERPRVLLLGDSFTYGIGVSDQETFAARMQAAAPHLEVVNAGVSNYGLSQELLVLKEQGLALRPDVVVVCVFWNDLANSYLRRDLGFSVRDGQLVSALPSDTEGLAAREGGLSKKRAERARSRPLLRNSYAYRFVSDRAKNLRYRLRAAFGGADEQAQDQLDDAAREEAWQLHLALLDEVHRLAREAGARLLVAVIPDQKDIYPHVDVLGLRSADLQIQERHLAWGVRRSVPVLDLAPALRAAAAGSSTLLYYPLDRHLTAPGHAAVAPAITERLVELGWVSRP